MDSERLSRRAALRVFLGLGATGLLAACSPAAPAAAPTSAPTAAPTAAPKPAATSSASAGAPAPGAAPSVAANASPAVISSPAAAGSPGASAAGQPRPGGTLRVGTQADLTGLDPDNGNRDTELSLFDFIEYEQGSEQMQPMLATSWDISPDYKSVTWHLRQGVKWHNGQDFTADDVVWNTLRVKDPAKGGAGYAGQMVPLKTATATDKYTVVWTSDQPWPVIDYAAEAFPIANPDWLQGPNATTTAVGTGPFKYSDWQQGATFKMVKNPNYWQPGVPYLDGVTFTIIPDATALTNSLEAGAVDMVLNPARTDVARLRNDPRYQLLVNQQGGNMLILVFNVTEAPGDSKEVRQAFNYALDRQRILQQVLQGIGQTNALPWNPTSPAYDATKNKSYGFDLDKARALLAQSGRSNISINFSFNASSPEWTSIAQIYQADLAKIGVNMTLKPSDPTSLNGAIFSGRFDGLVGAGTQYGRIPAPTPYYDPTNNVAKFKSDQYSEVNTNLITAIGPDAQKAAAGPYNDYILDQSWAIPIADFLPMALTTTKVQGLTYHLNQRIVYTNAWLAA